MMLFLLLFGPDIGRMKEEISYPVRLFIAAGALEEPTYYYYGGTGLAMII